MRKTVNKCVASGEISRWDSVCKQPAYSSLSPSMVKTFLKSSFERGLALNSYFFLLVHLFLFVTPQRPTPQSQRARISRGIFFLWVLFVLGRSPVGVEARIVVSHQSRCRVWGTPNASTKCHAYVIGSKPRRFCLTIYQR